MPPPSLGDNALSFPVRALAPRRLICNSVGPWFARASFLRAALGSRDGLPLLPPSRCSRNLVQPRPASWQPRPSSHAYNQGSDAIVIR